MPLEPTSGVKGSKPRLKTAKEEIPKLSREYLVHRNEQMRTKNLRAQMELARERGELISKRLAGQQATYLLVAMRQKILNLLQTYSRRLVGLKDVREVQKVLDGAAISILNEIRDLPSAVTDPDWLARVEENGGQ